MGRNKAGRVLGRREKEKGKARKNKGKKRLINKEKNITK